MTSLLRRLASTDASEVSDGIVEAEAWFCRGETAVADVALLVAALVDLVDREPPHPSAAAAVWALGKLRDARLRPVFTRFLARSVHQFDDASNGLWQALIALGDTGVTSLQLSGGPAQHAPNYAAAVAYLRQSGEV